MRLKELKKYSNTGYDYPRLSRSDTPGDKEYWDKADKKEPWRGPHETRELRMMLDGIKPAALIDNQDLKDWLPYIKANKFIALKFPYANKQGDGWAVGLPGEEWRIKKIASLVSDPRWKIRKNLDLYHAKLGRLLGYTKEQIKSFLQTRV